MNIQKTSCYRTIIFLNFATSDKFSFLLYWQWRFVPEKKAFHFMTEPCGIAITYRCLLRPCIVLFWDDAICFSKRDHICINPVITYTIPAQTAPRPLGKAFCRWQKVLYRISAEGSVWQMYETYMTHFPLRRTLLFSLFSPRSHLFQLV